MGLFGCNSWSFEWIHILLLTSELLGSHLKIILIELAFVSVVSLIQFFLDFSFILIQMGSWLSLCSILKKLVLLNVFFHKVGTSLSSLNFNILRILLILRSCFLWLLLINDYLTGGLHVNVDTWPTLGFDDRGFECWSHWCSRIEDLDRSCCRLIVDLASRSVWVQGCDKVLVTFENFCHYGVHFYDVFD